MGDPGKPNPYIDDVISQGHAFLRVPMSRVRYPYANDYLSVVYRVDVLPTIVCYVSLQRGSELGNACLTPSHVPWVPDAGF